MDIDVQTLDWKEARKKVKAWQATPPAENIFSGQVQTAKAIVEGVEITRLIIQPANTSPKNGKSKLAPVLNSFAVHAEVDWQAKGSKASENLPYNLTWLQANAGRFDLHFELPEQVRCIGLGERFCDMNLRGCKHTLVSTDNPHHNEHADALYKSIPFLILADGAEFTGIFVDSPAPQRYDLDSEMIASGKIELFTRRGFSLYVFEKTSLPKLVAAFTALTGRSQLPPLWSLGHQQSRWSYPDEITIRELAQEFRGRKIPCDTLVLDIDYMEDYRVFTHSLERFPSFANLAAELAQDNFKVITIVDPGVKKDDQFDVFKEGKRGDLFCQTVGGDVFYERVWPGVSAFPDFLNEKTRQWWAEKLSFYTRNGIAGIWNDMNEPAMFGNQKPLPEPLVEMPKDEDQLFMQRGTQGEIGHFEVRNLYGLLMTMATHEGLSKHRPNERPFILTRSASTGIQRYSAVWLGDNTSWWDHLQKSIPMLLNVGLSGVPFAGVDVGGFVGDTTPELLIRWYEVGIFYPFFRNHCALTGRAQEPFAFSPKVEKMVRHLIEWRYKLLPYIQGLFYEHLRSGAPLMRPLAWHFADDERAAVIDDQFMFGPNIMVAPVTKANETARYIYFPEGNWFALDNDKTAADAATKIEGSTTHLIKCPLGKLPAFVREGSIIALAEVMQSTAEFATTDITFKVFGDAASIEDTGVYFEDDGISLDYQHGKFNEWHLVYRNSALCAERRHGNDPGSHSYFVDCGLDRKPFILT